MMWVIFLMVVKNLFNLVLLVFVFVMIVKMGCLFVSLFEVISSDEGNILLLIVCEMIF